MHVPSKLQQGGSLQQGERIMCAAAAAAYPIPPKR
ncbi:hypothetical protein Tco_1537956, partial [Tanacetum coccineum]